MFRMLSCIAADIFGYRIGMESTELHVRQKAAPINDIAHETGDTLAFEVAYKTTIASCIE